MTTTSPRGSDCVPRSLISADQVALMLGTSKRTVWRLLSAGRLPTPVHIGRSTRWRLDEINGWIDSGCPQGDNCPNSESQAPVRRRKG